MGLVMKEKDVAELKRIADRERAPMYVIGETTGDMKFTFENAKDRHTADARYGPILNGLPYSSTNP